MKAWVLFGFWCSSCNCYEDGVNLLPKQGTCPACGCGVGLHLTAAVQVDR